MDIKPGLVVLQWIVFTLMLLGEIGLITTLIPGLTIIWLSALVYWLVAGFNRMNGTIFAIITLLMIGGNLADNLLMGAGARQTGASWLTIGLALAGGVVGTLIFPPFGGLAAALLILFGMEFYLQRDWRKAVRSVGGLAAGCGTAVFVRLMIGAIMIMTWLIAVFVIKPG